MEEKSSVCEYVRSPASGVTGLQVFHVKNSKFSISYHLRNVFKTIAFSLGIRKLNHSKYLGIFVSFFESQLEIIHFELFMTRFESFLNSKLISYSFDYSHQAILDYFCIQRSQLQLQQSLSHILLTENWSFVLEAVREMYCMSTNM